MDRTTPPLGTLRAFVAAGRHGSFLEAARSLGVTPSAVSHQVRALEQWVGVPLFVRSPRRVTLTEAGQDLCARLGTAFDAMGTALEQARAAGAETELRISALPLFTHVWLLPRLKRFEAAHPGVTLRIDTENRLADLERDPVDIAIRTQRHPTPGLAARKLLDLKAVPVCAPALAAGLTGPADLAGTTLIHVSAKPSGWSEWFAAVGHPGLSARSNLSVDTVPAALEAAAQGHGVALGLDPLFQATPQAARLTVPFRTPPVDAGSYFVLHRSSDRPRRLIRDFVAWIVKEMADDRRRLAVLGRQKDS